MIPVSYTHLDVYKRQVQKGETLHISYIGYVAQDVKIMGNQPVKVVNDRLFVSDSIHDSHDRAVYRVRLCTGYADHL